MRRVWTIPFGLLCAGLPVGPIAAQSELEVKPVLKRADASPAPRDVELDRRTDAAVERGLAWLAAQQNDRGFWSGLVGARGRRGYYGLRPIDAQRANGTGHIGVTALCGMAFLAGGHVPNRGEYGKHVQKCVDAVLSCIGESGLITVEGTRMYSHAFATLFLAEVHGMTRDKRVRKGLERATHIIVDCQNKHGGWRYNPFTRDSDLSVTVCQLQALRAARNIGIEIPKSVIDKAVTYVRESQIKSGRYRGNYYYAIHSRRGFRKQDHYSIQAAALTSLVSAGVNDRELIEPALQFLEEESTYVMQDTPHHYYFWYGNYYACQAFFHAERLLGNRCFRAYYGSVRAHLLADQEADGRWRNPTNQGPGDAFGTAVACIILQVPNQYLPIFQR